MTYLTEIKNMKYPNYISNAGALSTAIKCFAMQLRQYTQTKLATDLTFSEVFYALLYLNLTAITKI